MLIPLNCLEPNYDDILQNIVMYLAEYQTISTL